MKKKKCGVQRLGKRAKGEQVNPGDQRRNLGTSHKEPTFTAGGTTRVLRPEKS